MSLEDGGIDLAHDERAPCPASCVTTDSKRTRPSALPERGFAGALRMRHQADDIPLFVADAGNAVDGPVRVRRIGDLSVLVAVPEEHAARALERVEHVGSA